MLWVYYCRWTLASALKYLVHVSGDITAILKLQNIRKWYGSSLESWYMLTPENDLCAWKVECYISFSNKVYYLIASSQWYGCVSPERVDDRWSQMKCSFPPSSQFLTLFRSSLYVVLLIFRSPSWFLIFLIFLISFTPVPWCLQCNQLTVGWWKILWRFLQAWI